MRIRTAFRAFLAALLDRAMAEQIRQCLDRAAAPQALAPPKPEPKRPPAPRPALRNDAVSLLAALQREARFVDFIKESLTDYSDAQIGAVVRDVHRDCGAVLERMFALRPIVTQPEGSEINVPEGFDPGRYRLTGNVSGEPPFTGRLAHHGWEATTCNLPTWSGSEAAARVVAPVEVEIP